MQHRWERCGRTSVARCQATWRVPSDALDPPFPEMQCAFPFPPINSSLLPLIDRGNPLGISALSSLYTATVLQLKPTSHAEHQEKAQCSDPERGERLLWTQRVGARADEDLKGARGAIQNVLTVKWSGHKTVLVEVPSSLEESDEVELIGMDSAKRPDHQYGRLVDDDEAVSPALRLSFSD